MNTRPIFAILGFSSLALLSPAMFAQDVRTPGPPKVVVQTDGTVEVPAQKVPISVFLSPEAKAYVTQHLKDMQDPEIVKQDAGVPRFMKAYLARDYELFPVEKKDQKIGGVHAYVYTPKTGVSAKNKDRVLINLHGGGFSGCWPGCAELESIPVAALGKIQVVSVDYREGPDYKFPAASEDVASVYKELLKSHKPQNIGIYGCSAGGMQTAMSIAWFETHSIPLPGAIGIFCASAGGAFGGDALYTAVPIGEARLASPNAPGAPPPLSYFSGTDPKDPLLSPINSPEILAKFPPTLIITGTRDFAFSGALYTHEQLTRLGVDAELHVWEGLFHGFFYNMDVPESRDALNVIIKFFDSHLGGAAGSHHASGADRKSAPALSPQ
ncbi:MAG: alpha/beta hydrolase [Candidatus Acidiferrales bacterium]